MVESLPCSESSLGTAEPAAGTAAEQRWWVFVEYRGAWSRKGFPQVNMPEAAHAVLSARQADGFRVQLIRQPQRCEAARRVYVLDGLRGLAWQADLDSLENLSVLPWDAIKAGGALSLRTDAPAFFVCTHGRRDVCCARLGVGVYHALSAAGDPEQVWQTTHLGGHRFAATLLAAPQGICYGRATADDAAEIVAAHRGDRAALLDRWRGRCAWPRPAQAAEVALRREVPGAALGEIALDGVEAVDGGWTVRLSLGGAARMVPVAVVDLPPVVKSCGLEPSALTGLRAG